jgi:hypothetical protein
MNSGNREITWNENNARTERERGIQRKICRLGYTRRSYASAPPVAKIDICKVIFMFDQRIKAAFSMIDSLGDFQSEARAREISRAR